MATRKTKAAVGTLLVGADLLAYEQDRLSDKAAGQAEYLAQHPGWLPCSFRFSRPDGVTRGPAEIICYGTVNPAYIVERTLDDGRTVRIAKCPRTKDHNMFREMLRSFGWLKTA